MKSNIDPAEESIPVLIDGLLPQSDGLFTFRPYQRDDLARAAMHDGAIIGWDPGLGKTMAIFSLPFLKQARRVLIIAPAGLHEQICDEGREKFGIEVTPIKNQEAAIRLMQEGKLPRPHLADPSGRNEDAGRDPEFFITAYNWLGFNGADEWEVKNPTEWVRSRRMLALRRTVSFPDAALAARMADATWDPKDPISDWQALSLRPGSSKDQIRAALKTAALLFHPEIHKGDLKMHLRMQRILHAAADRLGLGDTALAILREELADDPAVLKARDALALIEQGIGHEKELENTGHAAPFRIRCCFTPSLASLLCGVFDFVIGDEAVRVKSGTAYHAQGVLRMASRCRYALTGTPIKNKLPDFFYLASWVTGHHASAQARWPYGKEIEDRGQFSRDFGVIEENLTAIEKAHEDGRNVPPPKITNQICNVHRLWRILGPVVIRRRKDDVEGVDLVEKTIVPVRVMPGAEQKKVYEFHLLCPPEKKTPLASIGAQLQNLRQAALNPSSSRLTHGGRQGRSSSPWTPKYTGILRLAADLLAKGEQLVIFSPFQDFSTSLAARFSDAGVRSLVLDGKLTPAKRGSLIKKFKSGQVPVLIAGIDSMGEGYSLDNARHLILPSLSWAFDSNTQAVERVHRLTSKLDVTIYVMVTKGTIDERLTSIWQEKGDSSDLALDGRLVEYDREEIDLGRLLRDAAKDFDPRAESLDESEVATHWRDSLCGELAAAGKAYAARRSILQPPAAEKPAARTAAPATHPPSTPQAAPRKRRSIYEIMKQRRIEEQQAARPEAPATEPETRPANIIRFPGTRPAAPARPAPPAAPKGPTMQHHRIADLLRLNR